MFTAEMRQIMTTRNVSDGTAMVLNDIEGERLRQIRKEGWSEAHDDRHDLGELAVAASHYARQSTENYEKAEVRVPDDWPWAHEWWKPKGPRRDLVRAAALLVAEIERLDRAERRE